MSDPFSVNHVDWLPGSAGRTSGFAEGVSAGYDQQYMVDSAYAVEDEVWDRWSKSLAGLERVTGQKFDMPLDYAALNNYVRAVRGEDPSAWQQTVTFQGLDPTAAIKQREPFTKANDTIKQLNDPNILSMEDIVSEVIKRRAEVEQRTGIVNETGGFGAMLGQFTGAVGGSFSERDPLLLGTLGFGGFGKTAAAKILTEMAVIGGIEGVQQYGAVEPSRDVLGEGEGSPLANILFAVTGAGILRSGVEGLGKLATRGRAEGDVLDLTDEMRVAFESMPNSPSARAGIHLLAVQDEFDKANPYPGSEVGTRRFIAELEEVQKVMNGTTETAIARFLPAMPIDAQKLDADSLIVQAERPVVYEQLVAAQNRLAEIDSKISGNQADIGNITSFERVEAVNISPDTNVIKFRHGAIEGELIFREGDTEAGFNVYGEGANTADLSSFGTIARDIQQQFPNLKTIRGVRMSGANVNKPKEVAIELSKIARRAETIVDEVQTLRKDRKIAVKEFKKAREQFDAALADIQREAQMRERVSRRGTVGDLGSQTKFVEEPPGETLRHDNVEAAVASTTAASEAIDDIASGIARGVEDEDGMIDLGNGIKLPKDFTLNLEDDAGNTFTMTAETIMKDLKDDLSLEEAVKVCSIPSKGPQ